MIQRRLLAILVVLALLILGITWALTQLAPATTPVALADCVRRNAACLQLPSVTGTTLVGDTRTFPADFAADINLVVMPFDRDQQVRAIAYVPLFQDLAAQYTSVAFYSIAALPDLASPIRLLVSGGMQAAISDPAIRAVTVLLYLEDQPAFIQALAIPDVTTIQVLILNRAGDVLWQTAGDYDETIAAMVRQQVAQLQP